MANTYKISRYDGSKRQGLPAMWEKSEGRAKAVARLWVKVAPHDSCVIVEEETASGEFVRSVVEYQNHSGKVVRM